MENYKTTVTAVISAIAAFIAFSPDHFGGTGSFVVDLAKFVAAGGLIAFGIASSDAK